MIKMYKWQIVFEEDHISVNSKGLIEFLPGYLIFFLQILLLKIMNTPLKGYLARLLKYSLYLGRKNILLLIIVSWISPTLSSIRTLYPVMFTLPVVLALPHQEPS